MLSREPKKIDVHPTEQFESFFALFPQTAGYEIYQPSQKLISSVWYALLNKNLPDRLLEKNQERKLNVRNTLGRFVKNPV